MPKILISASVFLIPLILNFSTRELFEFPKMLAVYLVAFLGLSYLVLFTKFSKLKTFELSKPLAASLIANVISTVFSMDWNSSVWGYYTRFNGGLISTISYIVIYFVIVSKISKKGVRDITFWINACSAIVGTYAALQHFGVDKGFWVQDSQARAFSTLGQPNWLAAYLLVTLPISVYSTIKADNKLSKILFFVVSAVSYSGIWFTYSLSGFLGISLLLILIPILFGKELVGSNLKILGLLLTVCLFISVTQPGIFATRIYSAYKNLTSRIVVLATEQTPQSAEKQIDTSFIRIAVWQGTLKLLASSPKIFLVGTGPETFAYAFLKYRPLELNKTTEWDFLYNKAHNYYLDMLSQTGILGFTAYLYFAFSVLKIYFRIPRPQRSLTSALLCGWLTMFVTNFFGWSTVSTSLLFFTFPAFIEKLADADTKTEEPKKEDVLYKNIPMRVLTFVVIILGIKSIFNIFIADVYFSKAMTYSKSGYYTEADKSFKQSLENNDREPAYHREYAFNLAEEALNSENQDERLALVKNAVIEAETAYYINPRNSLTLKSIIRTYYALSKLSPELNTKVEEYAKKITEIAPTEPRAFYDVALILSLAEKRQEALPYALKAIELKPDYEEAKSLVTELKGNK